QARDAQRAHARHHHRGARARRVPVRRGADRADLLDPWHRQADRRVGVQPRLRHRAGRRAGDGDHLCDPQPDRRRALRPRQPAAARLMMADLTFDPTLAQDDAIESAARRALRRLLRRKGAVLGLGIIALFVAAAVLAPLLAPYDPTAQSWSTVRKAPSWLHWFGTDDVGRDTLSRVIFGARASLMAGVLSHPLPVGLRGPGGLLARLPGGRRRVA